MDEVSVRDLKGHREVKRTRSHHWQNPQSCQVQQNITNLKNSSSASSTHTSSPSQVFTCAQLLPVNIFTEGTISHPLNTEPSHCSSIYARYGLVTCAEKGSGSCEEQWISWDRQRRTWWEREAPFPALPFSLSLSLSHQGAKRQVLMRCGCLETGKEGPGERGNVPSSSILPLPLSHQGATTIPSTSPSCPV